MASMKSMVGKMIEQTYYSDPTEMLDTQYGRVSVKEWLDLEVQRVTARGRRAEVRTSKDGKIALFVDKQF